MARSDNRQNREIPTPGSDRSSGGSRQVYRHRDGNVRLNDAEMELVKVVGRFRTVAAKDVPEKSIARLAEIGLVQRSTQRVGRKAEPLEVVTLTPKGRKLADGSRTASDAQRYWSGVVKPNELKHDLGIYRAYTDEAATIEKNGGQIKRVVMDFEFKSAINSRMNRDKGPSKEERRKQLAEEYELPIVDGKVALPDVRIEYVDADGQDKHLDVEVITEHYRGAHRAGKSQSGFRLHDAAGSRAAVRDDHHLGWI